jgi:hypothetical protein
MNKRLLITLIVVGTTVAAGLLLSCRPPQKSNVTNGTLHETATLDIAGYALLVVPETATIQQVKNATHVEIHLEKELAFHGHPPHPLDIKNARDYFGIATKDENEAILLATYGEWSSKEGGASIRLRIIVPEGTAVTQRAGLDGPDSQAKPRDDVGWTDLFDSPQFARCYWYTTIAPTTNWTPIQTTPVDDGL